MEIQVENGKIMSVKLDGQKIPLKKTVKIENYSELEESLQFVEEYLDLSGLETGEKEEVEEGNAEWDENSLKNFLEEVRKKGSQRQIFFLKKMAENPEELYIDDLVEMMNDSGLEASNRTLAGVQGSITKRAENNYSDNRGREYERIWEKNRDSEGNRYFTLEPRYAEILQDYFGVEG